LSASPPNGVQPLRRDTAGPTSLVREAATPVSSSMVVAEPTVAATEVVAAGLTDAGARIAAPA
jgi:hypothetical protein